MQLHDFLAQRQTESGAALLATDLYKRFENPPLLTIGNAFAVVLDADNHPFPMASSLQASWAGHHQRRRLTVRNRQQGGSSVRATLKAAMGLGSRSMRHPVDEQDASRSFGFMTLTRHTLRHQASTSRRVINSMNCAT